MHKTSWIGGTLLLWAGAQHAMAEEDTPAAPPAAGPEQLAEAGQSFTYGGQPINPKLLQDLTTGVADSLPGPVAVDVGGGQDSNRYFAEFDRNERGQVATKPADESGETFAYRHLGTLKNQQQVLQTWYDGGGSGVFGSLLLVDFVVDTETGYDGLQRSRLIMRRRGEIGLVAGYDGEVSLDAGSNRIVIGASSDCCEEGRGMAEKQVEIR